jgi:type II secretory pathway pseudopilin PulG
MKIRAVKGVTLFELLIATFVFTIALAGLLSSLMAILDLIDATKEETIATTDSRNMMERIRATAFDNMVLLFPDGVADGPVTNPYQNIAGNYSLNSEHITVTYSDVNSDPLEVRIKVSWLDKHARAYNTSMSTFKTR